MSKQKTKKIDSKIITDLVQEFITEIHQYSSEEASNRNTSILKTPRLMFSKKDYGSIAMFGEDASRYFNILNTIANQVNPEIISRKAIDRKLKDTILTILDFNGINETRNFDQRAEEQIKIFIKYINGSTLLKQRAYFRISNIVLPDEGSVFGRVKFVMFTENHFQDVKDQIQNSKLDENVISDRLQFIKELTDDYLIGKPVAMVEVEAVEGEAARYQALAILKTTVDIINFYSDMLYPPGSSYISIFGNESTPSESLPLYIIKEKPILDQQIKQFGPNEAFSIQRLLYGEGRKLGAVRINNLLATKTRNLVEERILSAMQWAGRATIDERNEESFLLYAIALESLVMERSNESELGYRLKTRISHLLGKDLTSRKQIRKDVSTLYGIRSAIVHKGAFEVSEVDLRLMRFLTKEAILTVLMSDEFAKIDSEDLFFEWFDNKILS